jgi:hypothetical protein
MTGCLLVPTEITRALVPAFVCSSSVLYITLPESLFLGTDHGLHLDCAGHLCLGMIGVIGQGVDRLVGLYDALDLVLVERARRNDFQSKKAGEHHRFVFPHGLAPHYS